MIPTVDNAHVSEALALLIDQYKNTVVVGGLTSVFAGEVQTLETALWTVLNSITLAVQPLGGGNWDVLDKLGAIVGISRNGLDDAHYLPQIQIKIRINRSQGLADDIIAITALVVTGAFTYLEWYPAAFEVDAFNTTTPAVLSLLTYLHEARAAGTAGNIRYSVNASPLVIWADSVNPGVTPGAGYPDGVGGGFPNRLCSLTAL